MPGSKRKRKMAIVLFADIIGFTKMSETMDAEEVINLLNIVWKDIDKIILDKHGMIDKHNGDNVIALWSIENTSKDDPIYATEVALEILDTMSRVSVEREVKFRVGIHYGPLIAGEIGLRNEFTVIGDTVNLAARLESTAENNTIQVSTDFAYLIQNKFNLQRLGFISVKGKTEPIETYRVLGINEDFIESDFIYFDNRLSEFNNLLESNSYNGNFIIIGERGIGKSELMFESYRLISKVFKDSYLLQVEPSNRSESLSSVTKLLTNIMKTNPELLISFNRAFDGIEYDIINSLLSSGNQENDIDNLSDELVFSAFVKFINYYISFNNLENFILYVDELKNIDSVSLNIFTKMIDGFLNKPFLFVTNGVTKSKSIEGIEYTIKNIKLETAVKLVNNLGYDLDGSKIKEIHSQTDGNLLFFIELVKYMSNTKSDKLPPNLNNLIQIQIESLSIETLKVVNYSSIPGYVINNNFLRAHLDQDVVDNAIKELVEAAIIHKDTQTFSYRFSNKYFFDQVYEGTLLSERKSIHLSYAKWLESTKSTEYNEIAYHYMKADELSIAFDKYMFVARRTGDKGLNYGCYTVCNIIEGFLEKINVEYDKLVEYYRHYAKSLYKTNDKEKAIVILEKVYSLVQENNDEKAYKQLLLLDVMNNYEGKGAERLNLLKAKIDKILDDDDQNLVAIKHFIAGTLAYRDGDFDTHEIEYIKTIKVAKEIGLFEIIGMAQNALGALYTFQGKYGEAIEILEESIAIQNKFSTDLSSNARAIIGIAEIHGDTGNEKKREEYLDQAIKILQDSNRGHLYVTSMLNMAECKLKLGQIENFINFLEQGVRYAFKIESKGSIAFACIIYARYLFGENRISEAYEYIGTSFNTMTSYIPVMEYVANIIYGDFDNIDIPNKEVLISKGRKRDPMKEVHKILEKLNAIKMH